jgi:chemotaxis protein histidine kinase CheA
VVNSSTILGDGTVALILDVPTLVGRAGDRTRQSAGGLPAALH